MLMIWGASFIMLLVTLACGQSTPVSSYNPTPSAIGSLPGEESTPTSVSTSTAIATQVLNQEGEVITVGDFQVVAIEHALTGCVTNTWGEELCPPEGWLYLWVHLHIKDISTDEPDLPSHPYQAEPSVYYHNLLLEKGIDSLPDMPNWTINDSGSSFDDMYSGDEYDGWLEYSVPDSVDSVILRFDLPCPIACPSNKIVLNCGH